ncbi:MAG: four helix bundle protein [Candidatus Kerfeldbacteria bacterium]|nr:four helix bundle protein [Candidatus Kerfeldbacteria bacterium]
MYVESFKQLTVWQRAIEVIKEIYQVTARLPVAEQYGLIGQMRRAAVSIPANIAEGKKRKTKRDFRSFLRTADGSAAELETLIIVAGQVYPTIDFSRCSSPLTEVQKMLTAMIQKLEASKS